MERRLFLKNIFGAAVIAAIPKVVIDQIEAIAPKDIIPIEKNKPLLNNGLYIYDKNQLIAASTLFTVNSTHHHFDTTSLDDLSYNGYRSFIPMQYDSKIYAEKLRWFNGLSGRDFFESKIALGVKELEEKYENRVKEGKAEQAFINDINTRINKTL